MEQCGGGAEGLVVFGNYSGSVETNPLLSSAFSSKHNQMLNEPRQYHLPANSQMDEETKMNQASQRCLIVPDFQRHGPLQGPRAFVLPVGEGTFPWSRVSFSSPLRPCIIYGKAQELVAKALSVYALEVL